MTIRSTCTAMFRSFTSTIVLTSQRVPILAKVNQSVPYKRRLVNLPRRHALGIGRPPPNLPRRASSSIVSRGRRVRGRA